MKTLGSVESFTGGLFASTIVSKSGASKYFKGAVVSYASEIKAKLGVDISNGVINANTALAMAEQGKKFLDVDICVAFTGNAGPNTIENKPAGLVYIAINNDVYELNFKGDRNEVQKQAVDFALEKIKPLLMENNE